MQTNAAQLDSVYLSMNLKNAPIEKAFAIIKQQTSFRVIYDNGLLKAANPITIVVKKAKLLDVLDLLFRKQPFNYKIIDQTIIIVPFPNNTNHQSQSSLSNTPLPSIDTAISGKVLADSSLIPLSGATITVKGSNKYTTTDIDGKFRIATPSRLSIIVVSYIGYNTKIFSAENNPGTVILAKTPQEMQEVTIVNTGYESLPKERATGSFTQVDNKTLNLQVGTNILDRLNGVTNGILFDNNGNRPPITVRGLSTINGPTSPLIVLNDFPYDGDINNINPNDIESISVLKDAAAASIWGASAGNGVIVITTKKGKWNQPLRIEFNSNISVFQKPNLSYLKPIATSDFIDVEENLFNNGFYVNQINDIYNEPGLSPVVALLLEEQNGVLTPDQANAQINALRKIDVRNDFGKYIYQQAVNQQYAINLRGGSNTNTYFISSGYDNNINDLHAKYNRINFRLDDVFRPFANLQVSTSVYFTQSTAVTGKPAYGSIFLGYGTEALYPYALLADASGNPLPLDVYNQFYTDTAGEGKLLDWKYYPLEDWKHNFTTTNLGDLVAEIGLQYKFMNHFTADIKYKYETEQTASNNLKDVNSFYTRDLINTFSELNYATGIVNYIVPDGDILDKTNTSLQVNNFRTQINYNQSWGKNNIVAIAGNEIRQINAASNTYRIYGYNDNLTSSNTDFVNQYPTFISGFTEAIPNNLQLSATDNRFVSFYANAAYNYNSRYTLSISGRRDASNLFGVNTNNKWTPMWSSGLGWNISEEHFYKSGLMPYLKLRLTYGYSGNTDPNLSGITAIQYFGGAPLTNFNYAGITQFPNPDLRWENVGILNVGIDFGSKKQILSGSLEYYQKTCINLIGPSPIDYTTGLYQYSIIKNVASMKGNGIDFILNTTNINGKFKWTSNFIVNYNTTKITNYYLTDSTGSNFVGNGSTINGIEGKPVYSIYSYKWAGLDDNGNPQGVLNKQISTDYSTITGNGTSISDLVYGGSAVPTFFGNLLNTFSYKRVTIAINIVYKLGYFFRKESINYDQLFNQRIGNADFSKRWQNPGDEKTTNVPAMIYPNDANRDIFYTYSSILIRNADNIRVQFINISYDVFKSKRRNLPYQNTQLYINFSNLGIIWRANKDGIDPDNYGNNALPPSRGIAFGMRTNF